MLLREGGWKGSEETKGVASRCALFRAFVLASALSRYFCNFLRLFSFLSQLTYEFYDPRCSSSY